MRLALRLVLCGCLVLGVGLAQRHGGGGGFSSGSRGGSMGGGFRGGTTSGSFHGGFVGGGGFHGGGFVGGGFRGGFGGRSFGFRGFYGGFYSPYLYSGYWPGYYGSGYSYPYYDYGYDPYAYSSPSYSSPAYSSGYQGQPASNVTVVYPPQQNAAPPNPVLREYDQYGQEVRRAPTAAGNSPAGAGNGPAGSPIYLIAFRDHSIRAAAAYWLDGNTLHYVTLEHQTQQASLDSVDRDLSMQLNRERHVAFSLTR